MTDFLREGLIINLPVLADSFQLPTPKFEVTKVLSGGMGTCAQIKACDGRIFALKMILPKLLTEEKPMQRYVEEMKKWLTLSACNGIVEAIMIVRVNDIPCVVSQWMQGGDLTHPMRAFNRDFFYKTIDRIATTLQWAYNKYSIIHRDLKPANILLDEQQNAYIGDWGLAKDISQHLTIDNTSGTITTTSPLLTADGSFVGTTAYASPEQILGKKDIDFRTDIYSLGCIMYEWETGHLPFIGKTFEEIASQQLYKLPAQIQKIYGATKYNVEHIIAKCLQKNPNDRYQNYDDFLQDFRKVASENAVFHPFFINERYRTARIGVNEWEEKKNEFKHISSKDGKHALYNLNDVLPYLQEAQTLINLKEYQKAKNILLPLYNQELFSACADDSLVQHIAINLAFALTKIGKVEYAIAVFDSISNAQQKNDTFYVNLSYAYIVLENFEKVKEVCLEGIRLYPKDPDIQGNLTIAYTHLGLLDDAVLSARKRLLMGRDMHALDEAASVYCKLGTEKLDSDYPKALDLLHTALKLDKEALSLNPNNPIIHRNIANTLFQVGDYNDAIKQLNRLSNNIIHGVSDYDITLQARILLEVGLFQEALNICKKYQDIYPNYIPLQRVRAETIFDGYVIDHITKDNQLVVEPTSLDFYQNIVNDINNRQSSDFVFLARYYFWMSEGAHSQEEHIQLQNKAYDALYLGNKEYPQDYRYDFYCAAYLSRYGHPREALDYIYHAIELAPWREKNYSVAASIYRKLGDETAADAMQQKYEEIKQQKEELYEKAKQ